MNTKEIFKEISEVSNHLFHMGWAERNAGNISIRLTIDSIPDSFSKEIYIKHDFLINCPKVMYLLVSTTGSRMRLITKNPEDHFGLLYCHGNEIKWYTADTDNLPSSEWISHLRMHIFLELHKPSHKIILHTHPTELIALSHKLYSCTEAQINDTLWDIMPEVKYFIPEGLGYVELFDPGSDELAQNTILELINHSVVLWKKHGCLASAKNLWEAIEQIEILNKAAKIYLLAY